MTAAGKTVKLTAKQERFCELVALEGMTQADAYRQAYDCSKMKQETIWVRASELMADSKVSGRVESLKAEAAKATIKKTARTREQLLEKLDRVFDDAMDGDRKAHSAAVSAIGTQAKLLGFDVQKVELSGTIAAQEVMGNLTPGQVVRASLAVLRQNCSGTERAEIVEFARQVMESEGYDFD